MKKHKNMRKHSTASTSNDTSVIISVYVESSTPSLSNTHSINNKTRRWPSLINKKTLTPSSTRGYDRRALLLEYSRQLRSTTASHHPTEECPNSNSRTRASKKRKWLAIPRSLRRLFDGMFHRTRRHKKQEYQHFVSQENEEKETQRSTKTPFWRKFGSTLKDLRGGCLCRKGTHDM